MDNPEAATEEALLHRIPSQSLRTVLSVHALLAAGILILVLVTGGEPWQAVVVAGAYFVFAGGWSWFKAWRAARAARDRERDTMGRET